jgi:hypothetical protein
LRPPGAFGLVTLIGYCDSRTVTDYS